MERYRLPYHKITVVHNAANERYKPLDETGIAEVRRIWSQGQPYYLYVGALHHRKNIVRLLQAYHAYYRQMTNEGHHTAYKLLIVGRMAWGTAQMKATYSAPGFPSHMVQFTGRLANLDLARVMASAYFHINVSYLEGFGIPVLESLKCGVPAIVAGGSALHEVGGNAALVVDPFSVDHIANALVRTTTIPQIRAKLQAECEGTSQQFGWGLTAGRTWQALMDVAAQHGIIE
jgi:glycosyltransferase involved in cell wall biosynthesis